MMGKLTVFILSAACLLSSYCVICQNLGNLKAAFLENEQNHEALQFYRENTDVLTGALDSIDSLWTVQASQLLQQQSSPDFPTPDFPTVSDACRNSTLGLLVHAPESFFNFSLTKKVIPLLDATGKLGAGLLTGNVNLNGAFDECFNVTYTSFCRADYLRIVSNSTTTQQLFFSVGLCVPKYCNSQDVAMLINATGVLEISESTVRCTDTKYASYSAGAIVMICVCLLFLFLAILGTAVDVVLTEAPKLFEKEEEQINGNNASINNAETAPLLEQSLVKKVEVNKPKTSPVKFITAFSLFKTVPALLATKQAPGVITSLNGLRVLSMFWVILGHTHFWIFEQTTVKVDNFLSVIESAGRFSFQAVVSGFFSVDSFFFLSGCLVAYLTLRQTKKKNRFPFVNFYVHRYLRLTPTMAFVLFFAWFLTDHLSYGPVLTFGNIFSTGCRKYWWSNFLYINNFVPFKLMDGCVSWTWYLANDMQFYVITPLILIPAYYFLPVGIAVGSAFLASGFIITSALTAIYDYQSNTFSFIAYHYANRNTTQYSYADMIYTKPWNRIAPYLVGLMLGYLFFKKIRLSKIPRMPRLLVYIGLWVVAAISMFWVVYGLYFTWHGHRPGMVENNIYITFSRFIWAGGLALVVFACHNGYGWFINSFLSMSVWTPLARMTFNAYLVHPIVMTVIYGTLQNSVHYNDITMAGYFIVFVVVSYGAAALVCIFVEFPLSTIEMLIFGLFGSKNRESQRLVNLETRNEKVKA